MYLSYNVIHISCNYHPTISTTFPRPTNSVSAHLSTPSTAKFVTKNWSSPEGTLKS